MKHKTRTSGALALIGSLVAHAGLAAWLLTREAPAPKERAPVPVEIAIMVGAETAAPEPTATEPTAAAREERLPAPAPDKRTRKAQSTAPSVVQTAPEVATAQLEAAEPAREPAESLPVPAVPSSGPRKPDLSPLAAALTMRDTFARATSCGALSEAGTCAGAAGHDAGTAHVAQDERAALIELRKELKLTPEPDGSYSYDNASFHARVEPDGRVLFEDKIRDLNTLVDRIAGTQVNTSEKRRFMQSTAALREQLASAAEAQNQQRAKHTLRAMLERLWQGTSLTLAQKRAALFDLWDDCASDASGSAAQAAIESFVRQHLPEGTPLAYSSAELAQLNRRRVSRRSFDPYASSDAGAQPG